MRRVARQWTRKELPTEFSFPFARVQDTLLFVPRRFSRVSNLHRSVKQNSYRRLTVSLFLDVVCFSSSANAISASTFMSLLPVGRWPRISITFARIINLRRGITRHNVIHHSSMKSRTFLNGSIRWFRNVPEIAYVAKTGTLGNRPRGSAIVRANREGLLNDRYATYFQRNVAFTCRHYTSMMFPARPTLRIISFSFFP